jgi:hypothetical protein
VSERRAVGRDEFLAQSPKVAKVDVPVPEFGEGAVIPVWEFTARERSDWELSTEREGPKANLKSVRERMVVAVCRNDDGSKMFSAADVAKLAQHPCHIIERIIDAAKKLNSVTEEDIEALAKNSEATDADS